MSGSFLALMRLSMVVDYLLGKHDQLVTLRRTRDNGHLDALIRMSQHANTGEPMEARILYVPGCVPAANLEVHYVVRRFTWDRTRDRARCRSRRMVYPDTRDEYFRLEDPSQVAAAAKVVEEAIRSLNINIHAAALPFEVESEDSSGGPYRIAENPVYHRWLAFDASPGDTELRFSSCVMKSEFDAGWGKFNAAWEYLWDSLGAGIDESQRLGRVIIRRNFPARQYARALASMGRLG